VVARCTVARLMLAMGLQGAVWGKTIRTTISDPARPARSTVSYQVSLIRTYVPNR
jgi:hypothetical protein